MSAHAPLHPCTCARVPCAAKPCSRSQYAAHAGLSESTIEKCRQVHTVRLAGSPGTQPVPDACCIAEHSLASPKPRIEPESRSPYGQYRVSASQALALCDSAAQKLVAGMCTSWTWVFFEPCAFLLAICCAQAGTQAGNRLMSS